MFANIFLTKTREEWTEVFKDLDACVEPILTVEEASQHPHNKAKETFQTASDSVLMANPAPRFSRSTEIRQNRPLPHIGQHTVEIFKEFGFTQTEINDFVSAGVITQPAKL